MMRMLTLMILTALNTGVIFFYQWYVVTQLGAGEGSDSLFAAMAIPQLTLNVISGSLAFVMVPVLSVADEKVGSSNLWSFATVLAAIFTVILIILWILAPMWLSLFFPGFSKTAIELTVTLTRIQLLGMLFAGLGVPFNAAYQARHRFVYLALMSAVAAMSSLVFLVVFLGVGGVIIAAWGLTLRSFLLLIFQTPVGFPFKRPKLSDTNFIESLRKLKPLILGTIYYKTDPLLDRFLASMAPVGTLSLLHLAQQIYAAVYMIIVNAIATPEIPKLSMYASAKRILEFKRKMNKTILILLGFGVLVFLIIVYPGHRLLMLVFGHGAFTQSDVDLLWTLMLALGLVWFSGLIGQVQSTSFYSTRDTKTPTKIGVIGYTIGIPLKVIGFYYFDVIGIAVATGLFAMGNSIAMHIILSTRIRNRSLFNVSG